MLERMAKYLGWREFVVAFFIIAVAGSLPNFFVGLNAALQGIPELSFGEIVGGNVIDMTLAVGLAILVSDRSISVKSRMVQASTIFTVIAAFLPWILILDKNLSRIDGSALLLFFAIYVVWLFSKKENFKNQISNSVNHKRTKPFLDFRVFLWDFVRSLFFALLILIGAWGVVESAKFFAICLGVGISFVGIIIIGLGNALPETYFATISAKKGRTWMILGDLMGSVIMTATFVLGLVVLIHPIHLETLSPFIIARFFLVLSALFFLVFIKTDKKITRSEAAILIAVYLIFVFAELAFQA